MRVLVARFSIMSLCVLAVSVGPARGQSPSLMSIPSPADIGTNNFVANFIDSANTGNVRVNMTNSFDSMHARFSDSGRGVASAYSRKYSGQVQRFNNEIHEYQFSNKALENTAAVYPSFVGVSSGFNSPLSAGASQNPPAAGAGQAPPPGTGAGQTPPPATGTAPDQSVTANIGSHLKIFGAVRLDVYYTTARTQGPGLPAFLVPKFVGGFTESTVAINARNSSVGVAFTGSDIGKFHSGGRLSVVFFDNTNVFADRNGFLLTAAYGELFNDEWRFAAGLQLDILAPLLPTVLTFSADGAPIGDSIKGQIRVERYLKLGSESQVTLQGGISEPLNSASSPDINLDEDNGWPNVEGRVLFGVGKPAPLGIGLLTPRPLEVAFSGVVGQLRRTSLDPGRRVVSDVWGVAVDTQGNFKGRVGFKGEAYTGQGLGQMTGGILQSLDAVTWKAIRSTGGWVEGFVYLKPNLHSHTGMFIDDVNNDDLTPIPKSLFGRTYNTAIWSNVLWDVTKNYRIAFEVTHRRTEYKEPTNLPNHGFGFQTQFAFMF